MTIKAQASANSESADPSKPGSAKVTVGVFYPLIIAFPPLDTTDTNSNRIRQEFLTFHALDAFLSNGNGCFPYKLQDFGECLYALAYPVNASE